MSKNVYFCQNYVVLWRRESILVDIHRNLSKNVDIRAILVDMLIYVDFCRFLSICHVDLCPVLSMSVEVADGGGPLRMGSSLQVGCKFS